MLIPLAIIAVSHLVIDEVKIQVERRKAKAKEILICFCIDQVLHLAVVVICWLLFVRNAELTACFKNLSAISLFRPALAYLAILAIIWDPTSVLIKKVFCLFPPQEQNMEINDGTAPAKAGEWIGKLERLIVIALVLGGAVSSIAFVLTAKSVARFKQFEDKGFVERYLVGTLLSASATLSARLDVLSRNRRKGFRKCGILSIHGIKPRTHHAEAICIFESSSEILAFSFLKSMSFWRFRKYLSDTPKNLLSLRDVSAVILRRPCSISWMRDVGTSIALAKLYEPL